MSETIVVWKVRLTFPQQLLGQPIIYELIHRFDLLTNIREARVTEQEGMLVLTVRGGCERVRQGLAWAEEQGVQVQVLEQTEEEPCAS